MHFVSYLHSQVHVNLDFNYFFHNNNNVYFRFPLLQNACLLLATFLFLNPKMATTYNNLTELNVMGNEKVGLEKEKSLFEWLLI